MYCTVILFVIGNRIHDAVNKSLWLQIWTIILCFVMPWHCVPLNASVNYFIVCFATKHKHSINVIVSTHISCVFFALIYLILILWSCRILVLFHYQFVCLSSGGVYLTISWQAHNCIGIYISLHGNQFSSGVFCLLNERKRN